MKKLLSPKVLRKVRRQLARLKGFNRQPRDERRIRLAYVVSLVSHTARRPWEKEARSRRALCSLLRTEEDLLEIMRSPLDRLKVDPADSARAEQWYEALAERQRQQWPAQRRALLAQAQRAQDIRRVVLF